MTEVDPREFYAAPELVQRPPEQDPPLTIRVCTKDERHDPDADRAIKLRSGGWVIVSGWCEGAVIYDDDVRDWHITSELNVAVAYRWHTQHPPERQTIEQAAERGDMDVSAFRTHAEEAR